MELWLIGEPFQWQVFSDELPTFLEMNSFRTVEVACVKNLIPQDIPTEQAQVLLPESGEYLFCAERIN